MANSAGTADKKMAHALGEIPHNGFGRYYEITLLTMATTRNTYLNCS